MTALAVALVATYAAYVWFALNYTPERPPSQGWPTETKES